MEEVEILIYYYVLHGNTMEVVTVKFTESVLKEIDTSISEYNFNSRTEFIREAVRDKLSSLEKEELIKVFLKFKGKSRKKTSYEENRKTRELVGKELIRELEEKFN